MLSRFVFFGDSVLDNLTYTGVFGCVAQVLAVISCGVPVDVCAIDGNVIENVLEQLDRDPGPSGGDFAVVSMGGNNALVFLGAFWQARFWMKPIVLWRFLSTFQALYERSLLAVCEKYPQTVVVNVYNLYHKPFMGFTRPLVWLLNWSIYRVCKHHKVPIIDAFHLFNEERDYTPSCEPGGVPPTDDGGLLPYIEPSAIGSQKIASSIISASVAGSGTFYMLSNTERPEDLDFGNTPLFSRYGPRPLSVG
ncbi:MAG: hypothetical protein CMP20_02845 [Rickettsiales bacterium]|nr:hypothetical protein [Rickettsiales bacterium]